MKPRDLLTLPLRYKPWKRRHAALIFRDLLRSGAEPEKDHARHLAVAIDWLCLAQDQRSGTVDDGGVAAGWSFEDGWLPCYPETTGYIIETFLAAAKVLARPELVERARRMIDWELSLQQPDGAFPGHFGERGSHPVIFNTGQIMHGMVAGYVQLGRNECLEAAVKAGHWLADNQDEDGCWRGYEHNDVPHTYNTRATWALAATALLSGDGRLRLAAVRNLDWALTQQTESGWFATNSFTPSQLPFTHTIAYAIRGLLESGVLIRDDRYVESALKAGRGIASAQRRDGWLAGTYADGWRAGARYCCLTGVAQMAINWLRLSQVCGVQALQVSARSGIAFLKSQQHLTDADPVIRGAIAGSLPIWGAYSRFEFPNWAAKFFADALMIDMTGAPVPPIPWVAERARVRNE
ncbi:MAG TPA: prenyltransferase/squalene oxidase repeat-containing protein [Vicinamibacterales bacterium]|nr:prenyltransferase/squalene oxidase repeat-containing protein [Vicinamibacterales bacterium]